MAEIIALRIPIVLALTLTLALSVVSPNFGRARAAQDIGSTTTLRRSDVRPPSPAALSDNGATGAAPMKFERVRLVDATCEPNCPEWLSAEGRIVRGSADEFRKVLAEFGEHRAPVLINSVGGLVDEALAMGRLIRERRITVAVAKTAIAPCLGNANACGHGTRGTPVTLGSFCLSACTLVLAGGAERFAIPLSIVGVHQVRTAASKTVVRRVYRETYETENGVERQISRELVSTETLIVTPESAALSRIEADIREYLGEMGIDQRVWTLSLDTPPSDIFIIRASDLRSTHLITSDLSGDFTVLRTGNDTRVATAMAGPSTHPSEIMDTTGVWPFPRLSQGRRIALEATFSFSKTDSAVTGAFAVRDILNRSPSDVHGSGLTLLLKPQGAKFRVDKTFAMSTLRISIPLGSFCKLKTDGVIVASFSDEGAPSDAARADMSNVPDEPPLEINPRASPGSGALFASACPDALPSRSN